MKILVTESQYNILQEIVIGDNLEGRLSASKTELGRDLISRVKNTDEKEFGRNIVVKKIDYNGEDKKVTIYYSDIKGNDRVVHMSFGKFLGKLGYDVDSLNKKGKGHEIEQIISYLSNKVDREVQFKVGAGEDITKAYDCRVTEVGSCMQGHGEYFEMLASNPNQIKILILNHGDKMVGRSLLFKQTDGSWYSDRFYTVNKYYRQFYNNFIRENDKGITDDYTSNLIELENGGEYEYYPYMDTYQYYDEERGVLAADKSGLNKYDFVNLRDTSGGNEDRPGFLDMDGNPINEDDAIYLDYQRPNGDWIEGYTHWDNVTIVEGQPYLDIDIKQDVNGNDFFIGDDEYHELTAGDHAFGEYAHIDDTYTLYNGEIIHKSDDYQEIKYGEYKGEYALEINMEEDHRGDWILDHEAIQIDCGELEGEWIHEDDPKYEEITNC